MTRSPAALNIATMESPAIPIELRDERMKTSYPSSRMSAVRCTPISYPPRGTLARQAVSYSVGGVILSAASFSASVG